MRARHLIASLGLGVVSLAASIGCGGEEGDASQGLLCGPRAPASYASCVGSYIDGSCPAGGCGFGDLATRAYGAWRAKALATSGLSGQELDKRVAVSAVEVLPGPIVRVEYVLVLDWVRSRQAISMDFTTASVPATDAEVLNGVDRAIESAEWTRLGAIGSVAGEAAVQSAFDGCQCDIALDWCGFDFAPANAGGALQARGFKELNRATSECLEARVDVESGELLSCDKALCPVE